LAGGSLPAKEGVSFVRFTYYSEKTVSQCMIALNERLHGKKLEGWVEKNGSFALAVTSSVLGRFPRTTRLTGQAERLGSVTVIKGHVSEGVGPREQAIIVGGLGLIAAVLIFTGNLLAGIVALAVALVINVPLMGDYKNSQILMGEVRRSLGAKDTPPVVTKVVTKRAPAAKPVAKKSTTRKTAAPKKSITTVKKPAAAKSSAARPSPASTALTRPPTSRPAQPSTPSATPSRSLFDG
jgi:hypothetical protein